MRKKERIKEYILMYKNDEVLSFSVEFHPIRKIHIIKKSEHFEEAPYCVLHPREDEDTMMRVLSLPALFFKKHSTGELGLRFNNVIMLANIIISGMFQRLFLLLCL